MAVTATQSKNVAGAARYFDESLKQTEGYYATAEVAGGWHGSLTRQLGLESGAPLTSQQFKRLLAGLHPLTGKKLAQRMRKDRRPGFDLTFSVPKSVSLVHALNNDPEIERVFRDAVHETMEKDVEPLMARRVRTGKYAGTQQRKKTGKMIYADFVHQTARPADGKTAEPHLHMHCFVMNATEENGVYYAAEPEEIFRQRASRLQASFEARLAKKLQNDLGYAVESVTFQQSGKLKKGWEIAGVARSTIEKFSSRTQQIEAFAEKHGIKDANRKGELGAKLRGRKDNQVTLEELRKQWRTRLSPLERETFAALSHQSVTQQEKESVRATTAVNYALEHLLYRQSTVERQAVIGTALEYGVTVSPEAIEKALDKADVIQKPLDHLGVARDFITTPEVLAAERRMIDFAKSGRGVRKPLSLKPHVFKRDWLNEGQKAAVSQLLRSGDTVQALTGGAGTGKSSLMQEAIEGIQANGTKVFTFAPSTGACEVLHEKGFTATKTVEHLIRNEKLHPELKDGVLWIDEAGLLSVRSMGDVFKIAREQNCRVILSGDARQHASPLRGEAFRICQQEAGLNVARLEEVQRQKGSYKKAVELISLGHEVIDRRTGMTGMLAGFDLLQKLGKIKQIAGEDRHAALADDYLQARKQKHSTLVVSPTHAEKDAVTTQIRDRLRSAGAIGKKDVEISRLKSLNLTLAQKQDARTYGTPGQVIQFYQNAKGGFTRGERYRIKQSKNGQVQLAPLKAGEPERTLPLGFADRFEVYSEEKITLSQGDHIRFTLGGQSLDKSQKLSNGRLDEINSFDARGNIVLKNGMTVSRDYGHLDYGYVVSSHASQGKDRTIAMAAMGAESMAAINARQLYVTVSRGTKEVAIYVDDIQSVRRAISDAGQQMSATEMVKNRQDQRRQQKQHLHHRQFLKRVRDWWMKNDPRQSIAAPKQQPGFRPHRPGMSPPSFSPG